MGKISAQNARKSPWSGRHPEDNYMQLLSAHPPSVNTCLIHLDRVRRNEPGCQTAPEELLARKEAEILTAGMLLMQRKAAFLCLSSS